MKEKVMKRPKLKFMLQEQNRKGFQPTVSTDRWVVSSRAKCLSTVPYARINLQVGFPKRVEVPAGKEFITIIQVDEPKSIVSIMFQTEAYDI